MKFILIALLLLSIDLKSQEILVFDQFDEFDKYTFQRDSDTTYVINFWATWCAPCVKELPYFEELNETYKSQKFKQILVSLDFKNQIDRKLLPFLNEKEIKSEVVVLADGKFNNWIDKVDESWSGAIPITIIYGKGKRFFYEEVFHSKEELENELFKVLKS